MLGLQGIAQKTHCEHGSFIIFGRIPNNDVCRRDNWKALTWTGQGWARSKNILGLVSASVVNTGDNKPMDHAPMPHGGGSTDDQCAHGKGRETVSLSGVRPHMQVHSRPTKVEDEERFRYQEINAVVESLYTVVAERNHLRVRPHPALSVVSTRYTLTDHTLSTVYRLSE